MVSKTNVFERTVREFVWFQLPVKASPLWDKISYNAITPFHMLLEASLVPDAAIAFIQEFPAMGAEEAGDALSQRAVIWRQLLWHWAIEQGQVGLSYHTNDKAWAAWIAWTLEEAGYSVIIHAWDFRPGHNFVLAMQRAATGTQRTIAVLSEYYLQAEYSQPEWAAACVRDPQGQQGALYWFEGGVTDAFGGPLRCLDDALGLLPGSFCPHDDGDPRRRPTYQRLVADGLASGFGADVGAALHFIDGALAEVVTSRPHAHAYRVGRRRDGDVHEEPLPARDLDSLRT